MNIAIDMSPLRSGHFLQHRVRGTGFYLQNLQISLEKYYPDNKYFYFNRGEKLGEGVDIAHYPYFEPFFLTLPLFPKNKTIVTVHDLTPLVFPDHFEPGLKGSLNWQIQRILLKKANAIITDSESSKKDIVKYVGVKQEKIKVVYLAAGSEFRVLNSKEETEEVKRRYGIPDRFLLYVGDATWNKNLPRLIDAVSKINLPLVMVGKALVDKKIDMENPWNIDLVKAQGMAGKNKKIFLLGFVPSEDLVALYNSAVLFVMPSIYEGFGLPVLEAMGCGCPVVSSGEGSLTEVVGEAGRYIDPDSVDSIAKGIIEVFNNQGLQRDLSQKGLIQSGKFTWKKTADETMDAYRSVVSQK
jgi:glycosyltransferase involved in cell wall biosynthesis